VIDVQVNQRVQPGGADAAKGLIEYGRSVGVKVVIKEYGSGN